MRLLQAPVELITQLAYRPDGRWLIAVGESAGGREAHGCIVDLKTGHARPVGELSCLALGRYALASDGSSIAAVWTESRGEFVALSPAASDFRRRSTPLARTPFGLIHDFAYSADARLLAVASRTSNTDASPGGPAGDRVAVWDTAGSRRVAVVPMVHPIQLLALSDRGRDIAHLAHACGHPRLRLYDVAAMRDPIIGDGEGVRGLTFILGGTFLLAWGREIQLFRVSSPDEMIRRPSLEGATRAAAISPDGRRIATVEGDHTVALWDVDGLPRPRVYTWPVPGLSAVAFSPDGLTCAAGGAGQIVVWDLDE